MAKGRQAELGTYEARDYTVTKEFNKWIEKSGVSKDAQARIKKAIYFGLGIKSPEEYAKQKKEKIAKLKEELESLQPQT